MSRMWNPTGKRQADNNLTSQDSLGYPTSKRHRLTDRVRVLAGSVKWSYLEMEDQLKCRFWKVFSGSRAKCNNKDCPSCYPNATDGTGATQTRDGRLSALLQKIRTWPKFGSRRIRDHTSQDAKQNSFGPSPQNDRLKAASFPVKHKDLSRARFLPRFKKFESIREESEHAGPVATANQVPKENEVLYMNVVGLEIAAGQDAAATPSVEDLGKYSYSFGSDSLSFGNRDDSMAKDLIMPQDIRSTTLSGHSIAAPADGSEVSENAGPVPQTFDNAWSPGAHNAPPSAGSSEVSESPGPGSQAYGNAWHIYPTQQPESPIPKPCAPQAEAVPQSRFSGVRWKAKKWTSEIRPTGAKKTVWLGTYATEEEAASAYDAGIFYFDKPKNYNFPDSEDLLPVLNRSMDERSQLNFIKTQARLIAKERAKKMREAIASRSFQPAYFNPGTPDTTSSGGGPAVSGSSMGEPSRSKRLFFLPSLTRA
ncbi:hypothetical protein M758_5G193100 [Ceratodon purpureus]|nr:hypothetical protein M758_5G193100 [Ceratodon purpureus]